MGQSARHRGGALTLRPSAPNPDPRLAEQDERIELLEDELQQLRDQADFTEKLLTERGGAPPRDALEEDAPD